MEPILLVALSNSKVAFVHKGFPFRIYTVTLGQLPTYTETSSVIKSLTVNRAKQHLVAGCYDGALHIWDLANPETQETILSVGPAPITALSVLPDDAIACGDLYGMLYILSSPVPVPAS
jgi:WD40 repeat protein